MQKTLYYLVDRHTGQRLKYYTTLTGAGIAQRSRNYRLGFLTGIERNTEAEQCIDHAGRIVTATYCIVEDTVDSPDLID